MHLARQFVLPLTAASSQSVIGSFEARFFEQPSRLKRATTATMKRGKTARFRFNREHPAKRVLSAPPTRQPECDLKHQFCAGCAARAL